jgi:hypothetical protein
MCHLYVEISQEGPRWQSGPQVLPQDELTIA